MTSSALPVRAGRLYDAALRAHTRGEAAELLARVRGGDLHPLPVARWCGPAADADVEALDRLTARLARGGSVLDVGCGPGRHAVHLAAAGVPVLGLDASPAAVRLARRAGVAVVLGDALDPLPRPAAGWAGVLLLDGNLGLGGHPQRLLRHVRAALAPDGVLLVELDQHDVSERRRLQLTDGRRTSAPFWWARTAAADLDRLAAEAGLVVEDTWAGHGRPFALLAAGAQVAS